MTLSRRSFFAGLAAAIAAPAVVKAESLMPVKVWRPDVWRVYVDSAKNRLDVIRQYREKATRGVAAA